MFYRQHASMQGRLHQLSSQYYVSFRSALGLMRMLAEVDAGLEGRRGPRKRLTGSGGSGGGQAIGGDREGEDRLKNFKIRIKAAGAEKY